MQTSSSRIQLSPDEPGYPWATSPSFLLDMTIAKQDAFLAVDLVLVLDGSGADI